MTPPRPLQGQKLLPLPTDLRVQPQCVPDMSAGDGACVHVRLHWSPQSPAGWWDLCSLVPLLTYSLSRRAADCELSFDCGCNCVSWTNTVLGVLGRVPRGGCVVHTPSRHRVGHVSPPGWWLVLRVLFVSQYRTLKSGGSSFDVAEFIHPSCLGKNSSQAVPRLTFRCNPRSPRWSPQT